MPAGKKLANVRAQLEMKDQGWGDTGLSGAVIVLHNKFGKVFAFSIMTVAHKWEKVDWTVSVDKDGGKPVHEQLSSCWGNRGQLSNVCAKQHAMNDKTMFLTLIL